VLHPVYTRIHTTLYPASVQKFQTLFLSTCIRNSRPLPHLHVSDIPDPFPVYVYQKFQTLSTSACIRYSKHFSCLRVSEIPDPFHIYMDQKFLTLFLSTCIRKSRPPFTHISENYIVSMEGVRAIAVMHTKSN